MLLVIFGAGASYDSVPSAPVAPGSPNPARPPLANELFDDRPLFTDAITRFPDCIPLVPKLRARESGLSLEQLLEKFYAEGPEHPTRFRQFAAIRFYLHFMIWECQLKWKDTSRGITSFAALFDSVERWIKQYERVALVSFNYDTLIEDALAYFRVAINSIDDYVSHPVFRLFKVHGSMNWARVVRTRFEDLRSTNAWEIAQRLIETADKLEVSNEYVISTQRPASFEAGPGRIVFPAIAIPVAGKSRITFECPESHLEALRKAIPEVSKVLVVGWRGAEEHFVELLQKLNKAIRGLVVAGSKESAEEVISRIASRTPTVEWSAYSGGFSRFVTSDDADKFLSA